MIFCAVKERDKYTTKQRNAPKKCSPARSPMQITIRIIRRMFSCLFVDPIFIEKSFILLTNNIPPKTENSTIKAGCVSHVLMMRDCSAASGIENAANANAGVGKPEK